MSQQLPDEIIAAYVFANTPSYLYRKLVDSNYVKVLAQQQTTDLIEILNQASRDNIDTIANAYAALIAALRKNINPPDILAPDSTEKLEWASALISLYKQKYISTTVVKICPPKVLTTIPDTSSKATPTNLTVKKGTDT